MTNLYHINGKNIVSAIVSIFLVTLFAIITYIITIGNIFKIDINAMANIGIISGLAGLASVMKNFFTDNKGNFAGIIPIVDNKIVPPSTGGTDVQG